VTATARISLELSAFSDRNPTCVATFGGGGDGYIYIYSQKSIKIFKVLKSSAF